MWDLSTRMIKSPAWSSHPESTATRRRHGGYKLLALDLLETEHYCSIPPVRHPKSRILSLPKLGEKPPIFEGKFELTTGTADKWKDFALVTKEK